MVIYSETPSLQETSPFHEEKEHVGLTFGRDRCNFTEHDRLLLNLIRPHIKQAYENVAAFTKLHHLERTQTTQMQSPPKPLRIEQNGRYLTVRFNYNEAVEQIILVLKETQPESFSPQSLEVLGLTKRESEVLFWVAKDRSMQEIAKQLGMGDRTVKNTWNTSTKSLVCKLVWLQS